MIFSLFIKIKKSFSLRPTLCTSDSPGPSQIYDSHMPVVRKVGRWSCAAESTLKSHSRPLPLLFSLRPKNRGRKRLLRDQDSFTGSAPLRSVLLSPAAPGSRGRRRTEECSSCVKSASSVSLPPSVLRVWEISDYPAEWSERQIHSPPVTAAARNPEGRRT